jgi:hypothetical protein
MATLNELLPFGLAPGANVLAQSSYAGLPARLAGFAAGTASSAQLNKVWRQSAFNTTMVGQFTMHNSGFDTLDDGDVDTYEDHFKTAIKNVAGLGIPFTVAAGGTADALTATIPAQYSTLASLDGVLFTLKLLGSFNTVTAPTLTLTPTGGSAFGSRNIVRRNNLSLEKNELGGSAYVQLMYDANISAFRVMQRHGGKSLFDPGSGALEVRHPPKTVTGAGHTYDLTDLGQVIHRSNGGAAMSDLLPGGGSVMPQGWWCIIRNDNQLVPYGTLGLAGGGGALLDGVSSTKSIYTGGSMGGSILVTSDGTNYWTTNETIINSAIAGTSNGNVTAAMIFQGAGFRMAAVWGSVSGIGPGVSVNVTLPISYNSPSFAVTHGMVNAGGGGITFGFGNFSVSGFDVQNLSGSFGAGLHWHTWGMI